MQPNLVTVSVANGSGKTLLSRYDGTSLSRPDNIILANGFELPGDQKHQSVSEWSGGRVVAKTGGGYIRFAYEDEPDLPAIVMFFKNLFG